ncbi:MAG: tetratricopeptide repeat protein [Bacteroidales bacterium]
MCRLGLIKQPIFFLFLFLNGGAIGQPPGSLLENYIEIRNLENDTNKVFKLLGLSRQLKTENTLNALKFASEAEQISDMLGYEWGRGEANYQKGILYKITGKIDSAIYYCNLSNEIFLSIDDQKGIGNSFNLYGSLLRRKGLFESALINHKKSLNQFNKIHDSIGLSKTLNYIGIIYNDISNYDSAIIYYLKLIEVSEAIMYEEGMITGLLNLAQVYMEIGEFNKARENLLDCYIHYSEKNDNQKVGLVLNKLGTVYYNLQMVDSADFFYNSALDQYEEINYKSGMAHVFINQAILDEYNGKFDEAVEKYNNAKRNFEQSDLKSSILKVHINLAVLNEKMANYKRSISYYDSAINLANEIGAKDELLLVYDNLQNTYKRLGNKDRALEYLDKYVLLKDSIFNLEKTEIIADLELKYEKEKNEAQILTLNNENLQKDLALEKAAYRKNIYLAAGGLLFLFVVFSSLYFHQTTRKNKQLAKQKLLKAEEEKKLISAQALLEGQEEERIRISTELHDGVGVLLSTAILYITSIENENVSSSNNDLLVKAHKLVDDANSDVRKISRNLMPTVLALHGLDEALQDLMENIDSLPDKYGEFHVTGNSKRLSKPREVMVYRLIQELISNTMKHANAESVDLELNYNDSDLTITYKDDGIGFDFEKQLQKKSVGLKSIQSRVHYLKGEMAYSSEENNGSQYSIIVPIQA